VALTTRSDLYRRALELIPGGVNSPVRAMRAVGLDEPVFMRSGSGAEIEDVEGRRYVDWVMSWGPLIFGHADPETLAAAVDAAARGTSFGAPTEAEVELAAEIVDAVPSVEMVRLVSSGTEASMSAIRLARGFTHRDRILKFSGCYHGHADALLASSGSGLATLGIPGSPGVPTGASADTIVCPYNDIPAVASAVAEWGEGLAAIVVEPVAGNMGVVPPEPGFLDTLRKLCDASGALLVFDEVITGFRVARGGAQERYGVTPDLTILGKIVGGGLPLAAFGGRADVMERLAPAGDVYQAGTLSGNPLATAAGFSVLRRLRDASVYERLEEAGARLEQGLSPFGRVQRVGAMLTLFMTETSVVRFDDAQACHTGRYGALFRHLLANGVYVAPSQFEAMFVSTAHGDAEIERTVDAAHSFFEAVR
jgi:glutamate-1-semialdehyde 2,1-aminomutase